MFAENKHWGVWMLTSVEVGGDFVYAVAIGALTHGWVMETETWGATQRIQGVQIKVAQFTPETNKLCYWVWKRMVEYIWLILTFSTASTLINGDSYTYYYNYDKVFLYIILFWNGLLITWHKSMRKACQDAAPSWISAKRWRHSTMQHLVINISTLNSFPSQHHSHKITTNSLNPTLHFKIITVEFYIGFMGHTGLAQS